VVEDKVATVLNDSKHSTANLKIKDSLKLHPKHKLFKIYLRVSKKKKQKKG
jgi:hypothetical protein